MEYYNYDETLAKVENIMERSGIRDFCQNDCKGECCHICTNCKDSNERNLSCSVFLCLPLRTLLFDRGSKELNKWDKLESTVNKRINSLCPQTNPWYDKHSKTTKKKFRIRKQIIKDVFFDSCMMLKSRLKTNALKWFRYRIESNYTLKKTGDDE